VYLLAAGGFFVAQALRRIDAKLTGNGLRRGGVPA
jgi:hypothetical protein